MREILAILETGIQNIFPGIGAITVTAVMELGAIPEWESAAAVRFRSFIEARFGVMVPEELLKEETMIGEIVRFIKNQDPY